MTIITSPRNIILVLTQSKYICFNLNERLIVRSVHKTLQLLVSGTVEELSLTGNIRQKVVSVGRSLVSFLSLRELDLSRNHISSLDGLQFCQVSRGNPPPPPLGNPPPLMNCSRRYYTSQNA